ncbi:tail fiber assembly protein [Pantoea stewartii]|uniref:tail fiber assembly protein n=1 Tax=Pantoea stewartii TaxID=66269 RepID=UPI00345BC790
MNNKQDFPFDENEPSTKELFLEVYNYDAVTGEFKNISKEYILKGVGIPAFSTIKPNLSVEAGTTCVYENNEWKLVDDHRGETVYDTKTGSEKIINTIGPYPKDTTTIKPKTKYDSWDGNSWITDSRAQHEAEVAFAEEKRNLLLANAQNIISVWQTELQLDMITDKDKASLIDWLTYIKKLKEVKTFQVPDVTWPLPPEEAAN